MVAPAPRGTPPPAGEASGGSAKSGGGGGAVLATLAGIVFLRVAGVSLVLPGFVTHGESLGGSELQSAFAFAAYPLALATLLYPLSALSDRVGRRSVLAGGLAVSAAGGFVAAAAPTVLWLGLGRLLQGAGAINGVALAVAGEIGAEERRARRMAVLGASAGGGFAVGLVLGALLLPLIGMPGVLALHSVLSLALLWPVWRSVPAGAPPAAARAATAGATGAVPARPARLGARVWMLAVAAFMLNASLIGLLFLSPLLLQTVAPDVSYSLLLILMVLPGGLGIFVTSRLADEGHARAVGVVSAALLALAPLPFVGYAPGGVVLLVGAGMLYFVGHSALSALLPALNAALAAEGRRGAAQGLQSTLQYLGSAAGSTIAAALYPASLPLALAFVGSGAILGLAVALATPAAAPAATSAPAAPPAPAARDAEPEDDRSA